MISMKSSLIILPFEKLSWITLRQLSSTTGLCQCHYDILGVPRSATKNEIRKAYIKKSQEVMYFKFDHPLKCYAEHKLQSYLMISKELKKWIYLQRKLCKTNQIQNRTYRLLFIFFRYKTQISKLYHNFTEFV